MNEMFKKEEMKKINFVLLTILIMFFLSGSLISARIEESPPATQYETYRVKQVCEDATYINISSITYPNSTIAFSNIKMTGVGSGEFYFDLNKTDTLGRMDYTGISDGCTKTFASYFMVTPSGNSGYTYAIFIVFIVLFLYAFNLIGFFGKNETMTLLGGMALMILGLYLVMNGFIIYREDLTRLFSMITIGWGFVSSIMAGESLYD